MKWSRRWKRRLKYALAGARSGLGAAKNREKGLLTLTILWAVSESLLSDPSATNVAEWAERDCGQLAFVAVKEKQRELAY